MPMDNTVLADPSALPVSSTPSYVLFYSAIDPHTKMMWCPDCRLVDGRIQKTFAGADAPQVSVQWYPRSTWQNWSNPHPARAAWGINSVPTVLKFRNGKQVGKIQDSDIMNDKKWTKFLDA